MNRRSSTASGLALVKGGRPDRRLRIHAAGRSPIDAMSHCPRSPSSVTFESLGRTAWSRSVADHRLRLVALRDIVETGDIGRRDDRGPSWDPSTHLPAAESA